MSDVAGTVHACRTRRIGSGVRSVWYLPRGESVHMIEDNPIPCGVYFLTPDDTGRFRNWVIGETPGSRIAVPMVVDENQQLISKPRTDIEVHAGNTLRDSDGCACPGLGTTESGVCDSGPALHLMRDLLLRDVQEPPVWVLHIA